MTDAAPTGVPGLDDVLRGGLPRGHLYLLEGATGTGKTTLGLQFLVEGARRGEPGLYVTLSETEDEIRAAAVAHGWSLDGVAILQLHRPDETSSPERRYTVFHPSEVELTESARTVAEVLEEVRPARVVIDSLSELRLLAQDPLRYRREALALREHFHRRHATALCIEERLTEASDFDLRSIAHGILKLEQVTGTYGGVRRRLLVTKLRTIDFRTGHHDFAIRTGGLQVYPRLVAAEHERPCEVETVSSGVAALDALLGGGVTRRSSTLVLGPAGAGKTSIVMQYVLAGAERGERAAVYMFDEPRSAFVARWSHETALRAHLDAGTIRLQPIDPAEMSAGEFAQTVRRHVERDGVRIVAIDSLSGYLHGMSTESFLNLHLHELLTYLHHASVLSFVVMTERGIIGSELEAPAALSYLADTVILLRYFEAHGAMRQAISVVKRRAGPHEHTIREFATTGRGVWLGEPLRGFRGVLSGTPAYEGDVAALSRRGDGVRNG